MLLEMEKLLFLEARWERDEERRKMQKKKIILQNWPKCQRCEENGLNEPSNLSRSLLLPNFDELFHGI